MSTELIANLRIYAKVGMALEAKKLCKQAADALEAAQAEIETLAAAGASPQPSQARDRLDAKLYQWCMDHNMILAGGAEFGWPIAPIGRQWDKYIIAAINAKEQS